MRFIRLGAFLAWGAFASFAVAGFAAFNPAASAPVVPTTVAPRVAAVSQVDAGVVAGRVAALSFSSTVSVPQALPIQEDAGDLLSVTVRATNGELASTTTTAETPNATVPSPSTTPPSTSPVTISPTTVTEATTTTTVAATTTTGASTDISIPPGTEPWISLIEAYFAPADVQRALDVMWCESRGDANATNPSSGAAGLYQHLPGFWDERSANAGFAGASIYDPTANTAVAAWLVYAGGGWQHWNPSAYCWG